MTDALKPGRKSGRLLVLARLEQVEEATRDQLANATGLAPRTVREVVLRLQREDHPLFAKVVDPEAHSGVKVAPRAGLSEREREDWRPSADDVVASAMKRRHPLDGWLL